MNDSLKDAASKLFKDSAELSSATNTSKEVNCYKCHTKLPWEAGERLLRHEECPQCKVSSHCCKMCIFYDTQAYNLCREPLAERIVEKETANFCSYFKLANGGANRGLDKNELMAKANSLFKD